MQRAVRFAIGVLLAATSLEFLAREQAPQVPSGTSALGGTMAQPRTGASAALLPAGRLLITGGDGANGPSTSAELFNGDGSFSPAAPMRVARSKHVSVALQDGRVLVAGETTTGGRPTASAEIYNPSTES